MTSKKLVIVPVAAAPGEPTSWRYHAYTRRDGRMYFNRLEIDKGTARLQRITFRVYFIDEAHGDGEEQTHEEVFSVDHALFSTSARTRWEVSMHLPQASISKIGAKLDTKSGESDWMYAYPVGTDSLQVIDEPEEEDLLPPVRTMGHHQYQMAARFVMPVPPGAAAMSLVDAFQEVKATEPQTFYRAYADVCNSMAADPLEDIPGTVSQFVPQDFAAEGWLRAPSGSLTVRVTGDAEVSSSVAGGTTAAIAAALNADPLFGGYFLAEDSAPDVKLTPIQNYVGTLSVIGTATAEGFTLGELALNITVGRKYTVMAVGPGGVSEQSAMSITTGPARAASSILINGVPVAGSSVTSLKICAAADGTDGPFQQVTTASSGVPATDASVEADRTETAADCPNRDGAITVNVKRGEEDWFTLLIPRNEQRSNIITAAALGRIEEGVLISADIQYALEVSPTLGSPGRPNDVRLVIE